MPLVERLMGLEEPKITVHAFFAAQSEVADGIRTVAQIKSALQMDVSTAAEYDALIALAPSGSTTAAQLARLRYINSMHSVFILAEGRYPLYSTPTEVRTRLGL